MAFAVNLVFLNVGTRAASTKKNKTGNIRTYNLTLWAVRVTFCNGKTTKQSACVAELHGHYQLHQNIECCTTMLLMFNLYHWQQCKLYVTVLERNCISTNFYSLHVYFLVCQWPSLDLQFG